MSTARFADQVRDQVRDQVISLEALAKEIMEVSARVAVVPARSERWRLRVFP